MTKEQKDEILNILVEDRNNFARDCDRRIATEQGKVRDIAPQPKMAQWIDDKCSVCGKGIEDLIESSEWYQNEDPKYCPFCGLKIRAESEVNNGTQDK